MDTSSNDVTSTLLARLGIIDDKVPCILFKLYPTSNLTRALGGKLLLMQTQPQYHVLSNLSESFAGVHHP